MGYVEGAIPLTYEGDCHLSVWICDECGALVPESLVSKHEAWHERNDIRRWGLEGNSEIGLTD